MSRIAVAVVDSGVHASHPHVGGVAGGTAILEGGGESDDFVDRLGHGTAVTAAIVEKAPEAAIFVVRVFDRSLATDIETLVRGIDRAARFGVALINLSLGTTKAEHASVLADAIGRAAALGAIVVSPADSDAQQWWPGSLPGVVAVRLDWSVPRDDCRVEQCGERLIVRASGYPRPIPGVSPDRNIKGISFAAANVTGLIASRLRKTAAVPSLDHVARLLTVSSPSS